MWKCKYYCYKLFRSETRPPFDQNQTDFIHHVSLKWLQRLFLCLGKVFVNFLMAKYLGSHMHNDVIGYFFVYELCFVLCFEFLLFVKSPTFWYVKLNGLFEYWKKYRFFFILFIDFNQFWLIHSF